ncbi:MAG: hypothetical protein JO288_16655 [Hyphomicrobiales bacterium]|nr:hypothetical protein [Hyphomicrobiales bacterium]
MNDLIVSTPTAPAPLEPRFAPESLGVLSPAAPSAPFAHAIVPLLLAVHYTNSALDRLHYDTEQFWLKLCVRALPVAKQIAGQEEGRRAAAYEALAQIVLKDLYSPEGAILVVDAHRPPFVVQYSDVKRFLAEGLKFPHAAASAALSVAQEDVEAIAVTGVGSSALGSAAFAWNVSEALHKPVAAMVPGFGLADLVPQALVGWLGFGMLDFVRRTTEATLKAVAPELAKIGRRLSLTALPLTALPDPFPRDAPESEVLRAILKAAPQIKRLYGHSKGAFSLRNAIRNLPRDRTAGLRVTTFGCVVAEETQAEYDQILGTIDGLGQLNSWGALPEQWVNAWHSTNTLLPMTMHVGELLSHDQAAPRQATISYAGA